MLCLYDGTLKPAHKKPLLLFQGKNQVSLVLLWLIGLRWLIHACANDFGGSDRVWSALWI